MITRRSLTADLVHLTDPQLAEKAQGGDELAQRALIDRYRRFARAKSRGYFLVGGDADDLEQEALIGLYKAVRDFRPGHLASFRAFAELCITRQLITAIKTATRQKHQPLNQYVSISGSRGGEEPSERSEEEVLPPAGMSDPADKVVAQERLTAMHECMGERLSEFEIEVLGLYVAGNSYQDIAVRLDRHVKSIDNAIQRIKRKVEGHLAERDLADEAELVAI